MPGQYDDDRYAAIFWFEPLEILIVERSLGEAGVVVRLEGR
jgi:hypothetical protein